VDVKNACELVKTMGQTDGPNNSYKGSGVYMEWCFFLHSYIFQRQLFPAPDELFKTQLCPCLLHFEKGVGCREKLWLVLVRVA